MLASNNALILTPEVFPRVLISSKGSDFVPTTKTKGLQDMLIIIHVWTEILSTLTISSTLGGYCSGMYATVTLSGAAPGSRDGMRSRRIRLSFEQRFDCMNI